MTGVPISGLPPASLSSLTDILPIVQAGTTYKESLLQVLDLFQPIITPFTTKGDIVVFDGTTNQKLGIGANTYVLTADSSQTLGMKWAPGSGGSASTQLQSVFVSTKGNDGSGNGTLSNPFATRTGALNYIGSRATSTTPFVIVYDAGNYSLSSFALEPWISDVALGNGPVNITVTGGNVSLDNTTYNNVTATSNVIGINFTAGMAISTLTAGSAIPSLNFITTSFSSAVSFTGTSTSTLNVYVESITAPSTSFQGAYTISSGGNNSFGSLTIRADNNNSTSKFNNEVNIGNLTISNTSLSNNLTASFINSARPTSITVNQGTPGTITVNLDASTYVVPSTSGNPTINLTTSATQIFASSTRTNYTPTSATIEGNLQGIDAALAVSDAKTANFSAYQSAQQTIPNGSTATKVNLDSTLFNVNSAFTTSLSRSIPIYPGAYLYSAQLQFAAPGTADAVVTLYLFKNNNPVAQSQPFTIPLGKFVNVPPITQIIKMNGTTDYVEVFASVTENGGSGLQINNTQASTYFCGALLNGGQASTSSSVNLQTVFVSTKGNDSTGTGTIDNPFATPNAGLTYALSLSPTSANPVVIMMDAGTYQITDQHMIYPNIIWRALGKVTWTTNGTVTQVTLASASHWSTSACFAFLEEYIVIDNTLTLYLDASAIPGASAHINFTLNLNCTTFNGVYLKATTNQTFNINGLERCNLGATDSGSSPSTIDSVYFYGYPGFSVNYGGNVNLLATNLPTNFNGNGNSGIGVITITSNNSHSITVSQEAGNVLNFGGGINASGTAGVTLELDSTTTPEILLNNITGTNYAFTNLSTQNYYDPSLLTDGSNVAWNIAIAPSALWIPGAANHTLAQITGATFGQFYQINIQMGATGYTPLFDSSYKFPMGTPPINTAANANNPLIFYTPDGSTSICVSPALTTTNNIINVTGTSVTMVAGYVYMANNASLVTLTLPSTLAIGDEFTVYGAGAGGWKIAQASGQTIHFTSSQATTTGTSGNIASTDQYDVVTIKAISTTDLSVIRVKGNLLGT